MPYTNLQYETLKAAIASGAMSVNYGDKKVEYRSLAEMKQILSDMEKELGIKAPGTKKKYLSFTKGIQ